MRLGYWHLQRKYVILPYKHIFFYRKMINLSRWKDFVILVSRFSVFWKMVSSFRKRDLCWTTAYTYFIRPLKYVSEKKKPLAQQMSDSIFVFTYTSNRTFGNSRTKERRILNVRSGKISECLCKIVKYVFILFTPTKL